MNNVYICGDIHGDFKPIRNFYNYYKNLDNTDTIIILGDFGSNFFFNERDIKFKKKLEKYNVNFFIIRGNHEERPSICMQNNPNQWHIEIFWDNNVYVENDFPYIKYALDYPAIYNISLSSKKLKTLVLPGPYSVDKYYRLSKGWSWFPQEQCTKEEMQIGLELAEKHQPYDLVLSHSCPTIYEPTDLFLPQVDQSMVDKTTERWLGQIEYNLNYKLWCWGHYHANRIYPRFENKDKIMLFNDCFLNLKNYYDTNNLHNSLIKIK